MKFNRICVSMVSADLVEIIMSKWSKNYKTKFKVEIVMNELQRFKYSADFLAISSHIIESAAISAS